MKDKEFNALLYLLDDEDEAVKQEVWGRLLAMGSGVVPRLEKAFEASLDPDQQHHLAEAIHTLQFAELETELEAWAGEEHPDLLQGLWLVARYQYPDLTLDHLSQHLDQMYHAAWRLFKPGLHPHDQVKRLNEAFFNELKFKPNSKNFHSPANSMINAVLQDRRGNPITLCVVYMLLAQRLNVPLYGVNMPNVFLLTYEGAGVKFFVHVYNRGAILSPTDVASYITSLNLPLQDTFVQPASDLDIVRRVLRNLGRAFQELGDKAKQDEVALLQSALERGAS